MQIGKRAIDHANPAFIIAEISGNHHQKYEEAEALAVCDGDQATQAAHALSSFAVEHPELHRAWHSGGKNLILLACQDDVKETVALRLGAGVHAGLFLDRPVRCFHGRRQGKAWERFERAGREAGAVVLNEAEYAIDRGLRVRDYTTTAVVGN